MVTWSQNKKAIVFFHPIFRFHFKRPKGWFLLQKNTVTPRGRPFLCYVKGVNKISLKSKLLLNGIDRVLWCGRMAYVLRAVAINRCVAVTGPMFYEILPLTTIRSSLFMLSRRTELVGSRFGSGLINISCQPICSQLMVIMFAWPAALLRGP